MVMVPAEAEDVTQDVLVKVLTKLSRYDPGKGAFRTWLYRIVTNHVLNMRTRGYEKHITGFGATDAMGSELLGISRDAFRRTLSRARGKLREYMNGNCGVVDPDASCRCRRKIKSFIDSGAYTPDHLNFVAPDRPRLGQMAGEFPDSVRAEMEEAILALHREHPFYEGTDLVPCLGMSSGGPGFGRWFREIEDDPTKTTESNGDNGMAKQGKIVEGNRGTVLTPQQAAKEALAFMKANADEARAASFQRYFKEPVEAFGVEYAGLKARRREVAAQVRGTWTLDDALLYCEEMLKDPRLEPRGNAFQTVGDFVEEAGPDLLEHVHRWLESYCGNWGLVDNLVPSVLSPLLRIYPALVEVVVEWTSSPTIWVRRGSAVAFVSLMDDPVMMDAGYEVALRLQGDDADLIQKAVGWMLREAGKVDRTRLEAFLLEQGSRTPRTTLRYAIEKFPKEDRKRIMEATKA
jgi:3-methyladenine DNA glycosylase AlkD